MQQTDAPRVVPVYHELLAVYPSVDSLAKADETVLRTILHPLGFHFRAGRLLRAAKMIVDDSRFQGAIPQNEHHLQELPGVGKYMARAVCATAFHQQTAVLDTNVSRILQRFFGYISERARPRNDPMLWDLAQNAAYKEDVRLWNLAMIDFGSAICTTKNPKCSTCPLMGNCRFIQQSSI